MTTRTAPGDEGGGGYQAILDAIGDTTSNAALYEDGSLGRVDYQGLVDAVFARTTAGSPERQAAIAGLSDVGFFAPDDDLNFWRNATPEEVTAETAGLAVALNRLIPEEQGGTQLPAPVPGTRRVGGGALAFLEERDEVVGG